MSRVSPLLVAGAILIVAATLGPSSIVARPDRERVISLYNIHTKETVSVVYKKDGKYVPESMEKVNWILRDWRKNEATKMDPELVDLLWEIHAELGSSDPIHVISGYRSHATNEMLRKTVGGQASQSRHILGMAADVRFPDVPLRSLRYSALIRERGGVGYYPTSSLPFVHVDTGRVRAWPRLPRYELALLFPQGHTQHRPAEGGPITREDVRIARSEHKDLAGQIAAFRDELGHAKPPIAVAEASKDVSRGTRLAAAPKPPSFQAGVTALPRYEPPVRRKLPLMTPDAEDRARLNELAALASIEPRLVTGPTLVAHRPAPNALPSLTGSGMPSPASRKSVAAPSEGPRVAAIDPSAAPETGTRSKIDGVTGRFGWGSGWVSAPAYDEEHPEELSYRPFPIGPLLTSSPDEPLFAELVHHDVARTVDMIDQPGTVLPLRFRPGEPTAELMWSQQFRGNPVGLSKLLAAQNPAPPQPTAIHERQIRTSRR